MKLALVLFALSSFAVAQTPKTAPTVPTPPTKTVTPHAAAPGAAKTASTLPRVAGLPHTLYSLKYVDTKIGTGPLPEPMRYYTVNYTGYLPDGTKFDSTIDPTFNHAKPFTFPYGGHRVITGWDTGFEGMRIGGKRRLFVPYQLGYGLMGSPPKIPAKTNLIFDVELVSISEKPPAPPTPPTRPTAPTTPPAGTTPPAASAPGGGTPATVPGAAPATKPPAPATPPAAAPATLPPADAPAKPATPPSK